MISVRSAMLIMGLLTSVLFANSQDNTTVTAHTLPAIGFEGNRFRISARVRTEIADDSASVRLWVRVNKAEGGGFFENSWNHPQRNKDMFRHLPNSI